MARIEFSVAVDSTERLDRFLADQLSVSRTQAARLVADKRVLVNGGAVRRSHELAARDRVTVEVTADRPPRKIEPLNIPLSIVYEDDWMLVIDKPAGLVVHPAPGHWNDTLLNALASRGVRLEGDDPSRPGIVHRLDKDTSGLMIVAKTEDSRRRLSRELSKRSIKRSYAALVWGHIDSETTIEAPVGRNPGDRKRMMVIQSGREASTHVKQVARFGPCDLVRLELESGRTHQIRVHLAHIGHPVVGDSVYGGGGARRISGPWHGVAKQVARGLQRQALHAAQLRLKHPESGKPLDFRSELPDDMERALRLLGGSEVSQDADRLLQLFRFFSD